MKTELEIYTLGRFQLINGKVLLTEGTNKESKYWKLLQYLITYRDQSISQEELITELNFQENTDPEGSLSSAVYRLRKRLKEAIGPGAKDYIKTTGCAYTFNSQKNYWLDAEKFEHLCDLTNKSLKNNTDKWQETFEEALELYQGDYLEEVGTEKWIWNERERYRNLLISVLKNIDDHLSRAGRFEELWQHYSRINSIIRFDSELMARLIEVLLQAGKTELARKNYEDTVEFFKKQNLLIPTKIKKLGSKFHNKNNSAPEPLLAEIRDRTETEGAYICSPETFTQIYNLEIRRTKRELTSRYTVHIRVTGELEEAEINRWADNLFELLSSQLRCSDVLCRWNSKHIIILLSGLNENEAEKVIERIKNSFEFHYDLPEEMKLQIKLCKIQD